MTKIALGVAGVAALGFSLPASAAVTIYNLTGAGCSTSGSGFGNSQNCTGVSATAWSNTGVPATSSGSELNTGRVVVYSGGLGITNQDGTAGPGTGDDSEADSNSPEHAIDNNQRKDSMLLSFGTSVKLTHVQLGYVNNDSDLTVLAFLGNDPTNCPGSQISGDTYSGLLGCGWALVSHVMNVPQSTTSFTSIQNNSSITSQYWLIGTYVSDSGLADSGKTFGSIDYNKDHVKLLAVKGDPNGRVPEPSSAALLGLAALGFWRLRRKA